MKRSAVLLVLAAFAAVPAFADCTYPKAPAAIPDGKTASIDAMVAANKAVKQYNVDIENYLGCIKTELDESLSRQNDTLSEDQKKAMNLLHAQKNNAAIDELQSIAARLNEQIRIYKAAQPSN
ncbi:MAG: hypothetical protein NT064_07540 [Proteobacteria bacterium]|nr:hypothetical protein [Pseudomonadota bacterium]